MVNYGFKEFFFSGFIVVTFVLAMVMGIVTLSTANGKVASDIFDDRIQIEETNTSIYLVTNERSNYENISLNQEREDFDEGKYFEAVATGVSVWSDAKDSLNLLAGMARDILHIPPVFIAVGLTLLSLTGVFYLWKLVKQGE